MLIRLATLADVPSMIVLADAKRDEYALYAPTFWRKAPDGADKQAPYFAALLERGEVIALVHEDDSTITGFVIASITTAPPVYDPGGPVCLIDDFTVAVPQDWPTVGSALLRAARSRAQEQGASLAIVVCGHLDEPKRAMLRACGFAVASEWYVNPL
jgi:predicted N-acetyltransferase YhbS